MHEIGLKHPDTGDEGNGKVKTFIIDVRLNVYFGFLPFRKHKVQPYIPR